MFNVIAPRGAIIVFLCTQNHHTMQEKNSYDRWFRLAMGKFYKGRVRMAVLQAFPFWIASLITGLVAIVYARLFAMSEKLSLTIIHEHSWFLFIVTPVCFVAAWWLVKRYEPKAAGSGIPQVMAAIELANPRYNQLVEKFLSIKVIVVKILSSMLMVIGGGAVGREGPTVQIAGSIFRKVNQLLPDSWPKVSKRNMIITGAAAGLAAAFNTPLGGVVFAVEELAKTHISFFKTAIFTSVIIAGLTAQAIIGPYLYLGYPVVNGPSAFVFVYVILVALVCGAGGSYMSKVIVQVMKWKRTFKSRKYELLYVIGCALVFAAIAYFVSHAILASGKEEMTRLLFEKDKSEGWVTPILRMIGPVLSFTTGGAGGVFAPALTAGATIGGLVAQLASLTGVDTNILVLSGMVAFLTGVTRSPFTSAILVLEMTDRHNVIFHLMLAGLVSSAIAVLIDKHSFYEQLKHLYLADVYKEENAKAAKTD